MSHFVELLVWAPVAFVAEGGEYHVEAESNIQLHCHLRPEANSSAGNESTAPGTTTQHHFVLPTVEYSIDFT